MFCIVSNEVLNSSFMSLFLITFAGFPADIFPLGTSFVTTLPAPIRLLLPIVTPGNTIVPYPI